MIFMYLQIPWAGSWRVVPNPQSYGFSIGNLSSLGAMIGSLMPYILAVAGLILLLMIIASGYQLLTSVGNPEGIETGKKRLTASLVGFILIFAAFWIFQLIQVLIGYYQFTS